jgi:hypothetical protein
LHYRGKRGRELQISRVGVQSFLQFIWDRYRCSSHIGKFSTVRTSWCNLHRTGRGDQVEDGAGDGVPALGKDRLLAEPFLVRADGDEEEAEGADLLVLHPVDSLGSRTSPEPRNMIEKGCLRPGASPPALPPNSVAATALASTASGGQSLPDPYRFPALLYARYERDPYNALASRTERTAGCHDDAFLHEADGVCLVVPGE